MYQNVFHVKMTKNMIKQQENASPFVNRIKSIANKKENVTLLKN